MCAPTRRALMDWLPKGGRGAEIGVQRGNFAEVLWETCAPRKLYLIDAWRHQTATPYAKDKSNVSDAEHEDFLKQVRARFDRQIHAGSIEIIQEWSVAAMETLPRHSLDWIYLDADHTYDGVAADLRAAARILKPGGYLCGHDFGVWPEHAIEVQPAVEAFCAEEGWRLVARTVGDSSCDGFDSYMLRQRGG